MICIFIVDINHIFIISGLMADLTGEYSIQFIVYGSTTVLGGLVMLYLHLKKLYKCTKKNFKSQKTAFSNGSIKIISFTVDLSESPIKKL